MRTKLGFVLLLGLLSVSCGGGGTKEIPQAEACPEASKAICSKLFSCSDPLLVIVQQTVLGGSAANCEATVQQNYCGSFMCTATQTYHGDKAGMCKDQFSGVTCAQINTAITGTGGDVPNLIMTLAPACNQVCS